MEIKNVQNIYFSPTGTGKKLANYITSRFTDSPEVYDILRKPLKETLSIKKDTLTIVTVPVYVGRVPKVVSDMLNNISCEKGALAIAITMFGNRDYEDALLETVDILTEKGFTVVSAGAFIGQHSVFPKVAHERPNTTDLNIAKEFAENTKNIIEKLDASDLNDSSISVKGNNPYRFADPVPVKPMTNKNCTICGACVRLCPTGAIDAKKPSKYDKKKCISCAACIAVCPTDAKYFGGIVYTAGAAKFNSTFSAPKEPELFYMK